MSERPSGAPDAGPRGAPEGTPDAGPATALQSPQSRQQLYGQEAELRLFDELAQTRPLRGVEVWYASELRRRCVRLREQLARRHPAR